MKRICLILLFCATAFGESNYEKGRLISITDISTVTQTVSYYGKTPSAYSVKHFQYRLSVQVADTVYVGVYTANIFKLYNPLLEFKDNSDVDVRIEGSRIHIKRQNGKEFNPLIYKRLDRTGKDEEHAKDSRKEASRHEHIGRDLQDAGDPEGAETQYRAALRLGADDAETHDRLGWVLYKQKKYTEAMPEFQRVLRLNPNPYLADAHGMIGALLTNDGDLDRAIEELSTSVSLEDRVPSTHYEYGRALEAKGKLPEALEQYRRAEKLYSKIRYTGEFDREDEAARSAVQRVEKKLAAAPASAPSEHE